MGEPYFYLVYHRPDRTAPWHLQGLDSNPGEAEDKAANARREKGGLSQVVRWDGFIRKEQIPTTLPANWRQGA